MDLGDGARALVAAGEIAFRQAADPFAAIVILVEQPHQSGARESRLRSYHGHRETGSAQSGDSRRRQ